MNLSNLGYVCLYVSNVNQSREFYSNVLGMSIEHDEPSFVQFSAGSVKFAIEPGGSRVAGLKMLDRNPYLLQFLASSLEELTAMTTHLEQNGVKILRKLQKTKYGTLTNFTDPDGNKLELLCINAVN